ncbi:MAG TPA: methylmalonyl Co-A mutase-associated GTPase MeaB [Bryobacteraceae bacterium]|jgi:LAO/AO transport system kinase|nr:methylmalonyl Co-A mutase-associated GTPase MeaB [Bryobacteraceae bacterium]
MSLPERELARLATGVENRDPRALAQLAVMPAGHSRIVGVTGPPGAGKSTLVAAIAAELRKQGKTVAIVAVDPSSRRTGGAILGDRIRMQQHYGDAGVFIRSMATRGTTGGLARATADMVRLMDAAGRDYVLIETVGVGQDEVEIAGLAQVTLVVLAPGMGDDIQAIKAGIMEIADIFVINKADLPGADRAEREVRDEHKPVMRTVATEGTGIAELVAWIEAAPLPDGRGGLGSAEGRTVNIDHLGIAVRRIEEALPLYESLGLAAAGCETVEAERVRVAMLPTGDSRIELLEPAAADSPIAKFLEKRGPGLHHVALRVPDLAAAVERLRAGGARLLNEPRAGAGGHRYVFVHPASTGGVLLELIQESER